MTTDLERIQLQLPKRAPATMTRRFFHSGDLGDIVAHLAIIRQIGGGHLFIGHSSVPRESMAGARYEAIKPLILAQPYISGCDWSEQKPEGAINLSRFREVGMTHGENLIQWQARYLNMKGDESPWLSLSQFEAHGRTVIARSPRYHTQHFPWKELIRDAVDPVFIGMPDEHKAFCSETDCEVPFYPTANLLELAQVIAGARQFIGNQSCPFWIACGLGIPIIQETYRRILNSVVKRPNISYLVDNAGRSVPLDPDTVSAFPAKEVTEIAAPAILENAPQKLILRNNQSPGDILMLTAAVRDLHASNPGKFITDVRTPFPELWENNPYITPLKDSEALSIDCQYPLVRRENNEGPWHFIHGFTRFLSEQLEVPITPTKFKGDIHLSDEEKSDTDTGPRPFWLIVSGGKFDYTAKWWDEARWQAVVDHFQGRFTFVQVGDAKHHHPKLKRVVNRVGKTNLRQLVRLMYNADGVLCPVTMHMHLAAAVETRAGRPRNRPCVVVAGGREHAQWEQYPHHRYLHVNGALPCCDNGGCWKSRVVALGDGEAHDDKLCTLPREVRPGKILPKCMDMIRPEHVITAVEQYLEWDAK